MNVSNCSIENSLDHNSEIEKQKDNNDIEFDDIPEYYINFFYILREIVKPLKNDFGLEICYLYNIILENTDKLKRKS